MMWGNLAPAIQPIRNQRRAQADLVLGQVRPGEFGFPDVADIQDMPQALRKDTSKNNVVKSKRLILPDEYRFYNQPRELSHPAHR